MDYIIRFYPHVLKLFGEHVFMVVITLVIALVIAIPLGFILSRFPKLSIPVLTFLGLMYSVPSIAFFALLIPVTGLGKESAIIALVCYSQLIMVRNVLAGFRSINPAIIEAGKGMGLNSMQRLIKIELPLAMPVIIGGIRIASVSVIGIATLAAWINAGGLGVLLFEGLYQNSTPKILWGTLLVSLLAISVNQVLYRAEKRFHRKAQGYSK